MKKFLVVLIVVVMVLAIAAPAFAAGHVPPGHPPSEQSLERISPNAAAGIHKAVGNLCEDGIAYHVFQKRFKPVGHPN